MGLGIAHRNGVANAGASLVKARDEAEKVRRLLRDGMDPIEERDRLKAEAKAKADAGKRSRVAESTTLARAARAYYERVIEGHRSDKHAADWINSLEQHVPSAIWQKPIASVTAPELLDFFVAIRRSHRETGRRVVQRLCKVFSDAVFRGLASGNVASAAAERLRELGIKREVLSYAALPFDEVPAFICELRKRDGIAARALEFGILAAARTGEIVGAAWAEFDLVNRTWTVPAERMKGGEPHTVYLSPRAVEIVLAMREMGGDFVFTTPGDRTRPLSSMAMLTLLRRMDADSALLCTEFAEQAFRLGPMRLARRAPM
jgi:integrase